MSWQILIAVLNLAKTKKNRFDHPVSVSVSAKGFISYIIIFINYFLIYEYLITLKRFEGKHIKINLLNYIIKVRPFHCLFAFSWSSST